MEQLVHLSAVGRFFSRFRLRHLGMGFFWACSMLTFRTSSLMPYASNIELMSTVLLFFSFLFNITALVFIAYMETRSPNFVDRLPSWLLTGLIIAGIILLAVAASEAPGQLNLDLFILGCAFSNIGYGYFWAVWSHAYAKMHPDVSGAALPLAFALATVLYLVVPWISELFMIPLWALMLPLPVVSAILLVLCRKKDKLNTIEINNQKGLTEALLSLRELIVAATVFSFLFGFTWQASIAVLGSVNDTHRIPSLISLIAAILLMLATTIGRRRWDVNLLYEYGIPVLVVAFALFPIMFSTNTTFVNSAMDGGYSILEILVWVMASAVAYDQRVSGAITGAIIRIAVLLFRIMGIVTAYFIYELSFSSSISPALFSIVAIVMLWIWLMLSRRKDDSDVYQSTKSESGMIESATQEYDADQETVRTLGQVFDEWAEAVRHDEAISDDPDITPADPEELPSDAICNEADSAAAPASLQKSADERESHFTVDELCAAVSSHYGLTRREAELLPLLTVGRSANYIADYLYISENTVRTHIRHILEKTGAESKSTITDFVYNEGHALLDKTEPKKGLGR